jgi:hypothetical protein
VRIVDLGDGVFRMGDEGAAVAFGHVVQHVL